jgi:lipopolysaccharide export LptBFGC system permease protein LptF
MRPVNPKQLRILSTVLLAFAVGQAGLGSGSLDKILERAGVRGPLPALLIAHATNAFAVLVLTILAAVFGFSYRRGGGPGWTFYLPLIMVAMAGIQITLGFSHLTGTHVFWGVLYLCVVTTYCSYTWRLRPHQPVPPKAAGSTTR